jgi:hypothetical protein
MKHLIIVALFLSSCFIFAPSAYAQQPSEHRVHIIYPPGHTQNALKESGATVVPDVTPLDVESNEQGIILKHYIDAHTSATIHLNSSTKTSITNEVSVILTQGSIHLESSGSGSMGVGKLTIAYQSKANFLAFVSGDESEIVIKSLGSPITITSPNHQLVKLLAEESVSYRDKEQPQTYVFNIKSLNRWWQKNEYKYTFKSLPISHAGKDIRVPKNATVQLDANESSLQVGDTIEWSIIDGPTNKLAFDSSDITRPTFLAEDEGIYTIGLQVFNDSGKSNLDIMRVFIGLEYITEQELLDVPKKHPYNRAINYLYSKGVLTGKRDAKTNETKLYPNSNINRAELLKLIYSNIGKNIKDLEIPKELPFTDISPDAWYTPYAVQGYFDGILKNSMFKPEDSVNYATALAMYTRALGLKLPQADEGQPWYQPLLVFAERWQLLNHLQPGDLLNRGQVAQVLLIFDSNDIQVNAAKLSGSISDANTSTRIAKAQVLIYEATIEVSLADDIPTLWKKGKLLHSVESNDNGYFSLVLPDKRYYIEAIASDGRTSNAVITVPKPNIVLNIE